MTHAELLGGLLGTAGTEQEVVVTTCSSTKLNVKGIDDVPAPVNNDSEIDADGDRWQPSTPTRMKRKVSDEDHMLYSVGSSFAVLMRSDVEATPQKKRRLENASPLSPMTNAQIRGENVPRGLQWHNNSCAYDAILTVIFNLWVESRPRWSQELAALNVYMCTLVADFVIFEEGGHDLEECREELRRCLQLYNSNEYTYGCETSLHTLMNELLQSPLVVSSSALLCPNGHCGRRRPALCTNCVIAVLESDDHASLQDIVRRNEIQVPSCCHICGTRQVRKLIVTSSPALLAFELHRSDITIDHRILITVDGESMTYTLRGVIYYGNHHFTSRFVSQCGIVWYHDGILTGRSLINEGSLETINNLSNRGLMVATSVVYARYVG